MSENTNNTVNNTNPIVAVTHDGVFHADDVFATAILKVAFPEIDIVRTRNPRIIKSADIVYDVGGKYNGQKYFDHHFLPVPEDKDGFKLSSAGMIWNRFGRELIDDEEVIEYVRVNLIRCIDQIDNGNFPTVVDGKEYDIVTISHMISSFNPVWNEDNPDIDAAFDKAVEFAAQILENYVKAAVASLEVEMIVDESISKSKESDRPDILELVRFCPWDDRIDAVREHGFKMIMFEDPRSEMWMLRTIPREDLPGRGVYELPKSLWGLRGDDAPDGVEFIHPAGFIAGGDREALIKLAKRVVYDQE